MHSEFYCNWIGVFGAVNCKQLKSAVLLIINCKLFIMVIAEENGQGKYWMPKSQVPRIHHPQNLLIGDREMQSGLTKG